MAKFKKLSPKQIPTTNHLYLDDLTPEEQQAYQEISDYLVENYNCDSDIRVSMIGQVLINSELNEDAELQ